MKIDKKTEQKQKIIHFAHLRFAEHGFKKTNINEIAQDCDMSPANLYRFFKNKEEIGATVVELQMSHTTELAVRILNSDSSSRQKLKDYTLEKLTFNYGFFANRCNLFELVAMIFSKHPEMPKTYMQLQRDFFTDVLAEGQTKLEIKAQPISQLSELIFQALRGFTMPPALMAGVPTLEIMQQQTIGLIDLIFDGIAV